MFQEDKELCTGCGACAEKCPKNAITLKEDLNGFLFPQVDNILCINCGICDGVCPLKAKPYFNTPKNAYLFVHEDKAVLRHSTSGGAFTVLSDYILSQNGTIFGTTLGSDFSAIFVAANDEADRDKMRGSLYVQSDTDGVYSKIKDCLENDNKALFIGTPCQVAGLYGYLGKNLKYKNLITVDFICHGVPNNAFFKEHIKRLQNKYKQKIVKYSFRDKKYAWYSHGIEEAVCENGRILSNSDVQTYNYFFICNASLRESCFTCPYRDLKRVSDITIADFWGVRNIDGKKHRNGASLMIANSQSGVEVITALRSKGLVEIPFDKVKNRFANKEIKSQIDRREFWRTFNESGYDGIVNHYPACKQGGGRLIIKKILQKNYFLR